jgi:hypothetical protein
MLLKTRHQRKYCFLSTCDNKILLGSIRTHSQLSCFLASSLRQRDHECELWIMTVRFGTESLWHVDIPRYFLLDLSISTALMNECPGGSIEFCLVNETLCPLLPRSLSSVLQLPWISPHCSVQWDHHYIWVFILELQLGKFSLVEYVQTYSSTHVFPFSCRLRSSFAHF